MFKNVIFDFGNVLVEFSERHITAPYVSKENAEEFNAAFFDRLYWDKLDAGTISDKEVISACKERLPIRLHGYISDIYYNWIYNIPEIEGMKALVSDIKKDFGVRVFLLSNISEYFASHTDKIPCLAEFEKCIFSAVCKYTKPNREIFAYLCSECSILPHETIFIDDNEKNIKGAEAYGIRGYLFDKDVNKLRSELYSILSN